MSTTTQNSIMHLLVAKAIARTGTTALDPSAASYLVNGEVAVVDIDGTILTAGTVVGKSKIRIVQSQGALLPSIQSPEIEKAGVKTYKQSGAIGTNGHVAPALQVDYIGYNAVTAVGDIDVINSNGYEVMIHDISSAAYGSTGVSKFGFFVSDLTATKTKIVDGMTLSLYQNTAKIVRKPFIAERVSSAANTPVVGTATTFTATKDSITVTANGTVTSIAAGDYIKLGGTGVSVAVYKVVSIVSGATSIIVLDIPFQQASAILAVASVVSITAAAFAAGLVGIKLTGLAPVFITPQSTEYYVNRWSTNLRNFGATTATNAVLATEGVGTYAALACLEYFLIGNEGFISRHDMPYIDPRASVVISATYGFITLEWDSIKSGQLFNTQANSKQLLIAFTTGGNREQVIGVGTSVQTVLNAWLSSFTASALV